MDIGEFFWGWQKMVASRSKYANQKTQEFFFLLAHILLNLDFFQQHTWWFESRKWDAICGKLCDFVFNMGFGRKRQICWKIFYDVWFHKNLLSLEKYFVKSIISTYLIISKIYSSTRENIDFTKFLWHTFCTVKLHNFHHKNEKTQGN